MNPRTVFENFSQHFGRFTVARDGEIEDQLFDRKEIPKNPGGNVPQSVIRDLKEQIRETVSGFANANPEGGLLVIGIQRMVRFAASIT